MKNDILSYKTVASGENSVEAKIKNLQVGKLKTCKNFLRLDIEAAIRSHHAIAEAAAIGIPDEIRGEAIAIYATLKTNLPSHYIANYDIIKDEIIKAVEITESLPVQNRSNSSAIFPRPELVNLSGG